jgi:adenine-specific DNA-methyltransferase
MTDSTTVYAKFRSKMSELFQMDRADLDFGMYRIMNVKRGEINDYLENELYPQVAEVLRKYAGRDKQNKQRELEEAIKQAEGLGVDPNTTRKVKDLKQELSEAVDTEELERKVFSHLYTFFSRYYDKGDFISKRRYKDGAYMVPYDGEEVKLVWANMDQYYIKTSEYLRN